MWIVAGVGFAGVAFSFLVGFFPPTQLPVGSPTLYVWLVVGGAVVFTGLPLLIGNAEAVVMAGRRSGQSVFLEGGLTPSAHFNGEALRAGLALSRRFRTRVPMQASVKAPILISEAARTQRNR